MVWKRVAPWSMILVSALTFAASGCGSSMKDGTDSSGETESTAPENTDAGEGYQLPRIYFQLEEQQGFEEHALLTEYLMKNSYTDSIETIMSVKEEYWDYLDSLNGHRSVDEQLRVIAENRSQWCSDLEYAGELCQYAVADDTEGAAAQLEQSLNVYSSHLGESG